MIILIICIITIIAIIFKTNLHRTCPMFSTQLKIYKKNWFAELPENAMLTETDSKTGGSRGYREIFQTVNHRL